MRLEYLNTLKLLHKLRASKMLISCEPLEKISLLGKFLYLNLLFSFLAACLKEVNNDVSKE